MKNAKTLDAGQDLALRKRLDKPARLDKQAVLRKSSQEERSGWLGHWLSMHFGPGKLSPDEFLYYGLQQVSLSNEHRKRYVGKLAQNRFHNVCNMATWFSTAHNKLLLHYLLKGAGLPHPALRFALLKDAAGMVAGQGPMNVDTLVDFLEASTGFPLFAKPIEGMYSIGAMQINSFADDAVQLDGYGTVPVETLVQYMSSIDERGYLFQELLTPPSAWTDLFGPRLPSARIMVLLEDTGPRVHLATLKIPDGTHEADNFWREGNMLAPIDVDSGKLGLPVRFNATTLEHIELHPLTGNPMAGSIVPDWQQLCQHVCQAATLLPGIRTQGWDVALTSEGPVLLELNFGGDLNLHQLAHGRGVMDDRYISHLFNCGYKGKLPAVH